MNILVTGAAGFIGSRLSERLLKDGHHVIGLDALTPNYSVEQKKTNIEPLLTYPAFTFQQADLRRDELGDTVGSVDTVIHLAALAGLLDWSHLGEYISFNIQATHRLLDAVRKSGIKHFVYGSTSSVYGKEATGAESAPLKPCSPYGLTKAAAEMLCRSYANEHSIPLTVLRFFSVYGPGQRPDMGYYKFIDALLGKRPLTVFGSGEQSRSNTYISDCVDGISLVTEKRAESAGETFNVGGGEEVTVNSVIAILENLTGTKAHIRHAPPRPGDQSRTAANTVKIRAMLGFSPGTSITDGLKSQLEWQRSLCK